MGIELGPQVAEGVDRQIFVTASGTFLVKIRKSLSRPGNPNWSKRLENRLVPMARFRFENIEILHELNVRMRASLLGVESPFAPLRGVAETDLGLGLMAEPIWGADGILAPTLATIYQNDGLSDTLLDELNLRTQHLFMLGAAMFDYNPRNIVLGAPSGGQKRLYVVDGYGERTLLKLRTHVGLFRRRHLHKQCGKLAKQISLQWNEKTLSFRRLNTS